MTNLSIYSLRQTYLKLICILSYIGYRCISSLSSKVGSYSYLYQWRNDRLLHEMIQTRRILCFNYNLLCVSQHLAPKHPNSHLFYLFFFKKTLRLYKKRHIAKHIENNKVCMCVCVCVFYVRLFVHLLNVCMERRFGVGTDNNFCRKWGMQYLATITGIERHESDGYKKAGHS